MVQNNESALNNKQSVLARDRQYDCSAAALSLVHSSDGDGSGDGSTKLHTNPAKRRRNKRKQNLPFSSVPSPFYRVYYAIRASVSVASVNQALVL